MNRGLLLENERYAWIFLNLIPELGPVRFHRLLHAAKSARGVLELPMSGLQAAEVSEQQAERWHRAFRDPLYERWLEAELGREVKGVCGVVTELDEQYPAPLRELYARPPVLYYKGRWPAPLERGVGLVGTRRPSEYGRSVAERLATDLSIQGVTTISGLARGIDTCVHQATLKAGGYTVAVLGCGLGQVFPKENESLQGRIAEAGAVVSEFPYEVFPEPGHFPRRNRIISGLSQGVVVIEAGEQSGALITARYAAEQGRDVFAVPGSIFNPVSAGCHRLIREGARLVEKTADVLDELGIARTKEATPSPGHECFDTLTPLEKHIANLLSETPLSADEISHETSERFEQVANSLLSLELKGVIRTLPGQRYARK